MDIVRRWDVQVEVEVGLLHLVIDYGLVSLELDEQCLLVIIYECMVRFLITPTCIFIFISSLGSV